MNENKELLTVEFRYDDVNVMKSEVDYKNRTVTIGIYDSFDEAITEGNKALDKLYAFIKFDSSDRFVKNHLWGTPRRLVCSHRYDVFVKITQLKFEDIELFAAEVRNSSRRVYEFHKLNNKD
mgnify:FL=1